MRKTKHVPMWVRRMRRGWLRHCLIGLFLPLTRSERRELYW